ncbi:tripartite motif-containing protein 45-like [Patella vulgata]|uniref:tripartite motif-containing protein 45-like n=1 Tax=Patella vulgata TaxID=6465 RepID=UPI0024A919D6|nr:tripartite motif-containing protein 45-like [Patella vulgata]
MAEKNDRLNCSICLNDFKKPKILDCFHSFCESCLSDYVSKFEENGEFMCPLCRRTIPIPTGGVKDLASNVYIEERQSVNQPESNPPCNICDKDNQSQFRCKDCDKFLCDSCKNTHDLLVSGLNHYVISLDEDDPDDVKPVRHVICQHHQKKFAVYCSDCSKVICSKCSKKKHEHHTVISTDVTNVTRASLWKLMKDIDRKIQRLCDCRDVVKTSSSELHQSITTACKLVDQQVTIICEIVKSYGEKFKLDIKKSQIDEANLNQMHEELITLIDELKTGIAELSDDLSTGDSVDLLDGFSDLRKKLTVIEKKPFYIPDFKIPSLKLGEEYCQSLRNAIGQVEYTQSIQHTFSLIANATEKTLSSPCYIVQGTPLCIELEYETCGYFYVDLKMMEGAFESRVTLETSLDTRTWQRPNQKRQYFWKINPFFPSYRIMQTLETVTIKAIFTTPNQDMAIAII